MHREYINNYRMDRVSGFSFDLMIVAGVTVIEINDIKNYILPILVLSVVETVGTYVYTFVQSSISSSATSQIPGQLCSLYLS